MSCDSKRAVSCKVTKSRVEFLMREAPRLKLGPLILMGTTSANGMRTKHILINGEPLSRFSFSC